MLTIFYQKLTQKVNTMICDAIENKEGLLGARAPLLKANKLGHQINRNNKQAGANITMKNISRDLMAKPIVELQTNLKKILQGNSMTFSDKHLGKRLKNKPSEILMIFTKTFKRNTRNNNIKNEPLLKLISSKVLMRMIFEIKMINSFEKNTSKLKDE